LHIKVPVKTRQEGEAIRVALTDPQTRAFVVLVGTLLPFSDRARERILRFVADSALDPTSPLRVEVSETPTKGGDDPPAPLRSSRFLTWR
jgi:hypothetical protein